MSLEGLRAWIGEVERKLGKRTRVFLALAVIAIGLGGAAIYLAIDARESSVSENDVQQLQQELEVQIDEAASGASAPAGAPVEPVQPEPGTEPDSEPGTNSEPEAKPKSGSNQGDEAGGTGTGASSGAGNSEVPDNPDSAKIQELLEQAKEQNAEAEADSAGK
jgi:hypothetical protein